VLTSCVTTNNCPVHARPRSH